MAPTKELPQAKERIVFTDVEIAAAIGASISWVRFDRRTARILPFYRLGRLIRYDRASVLIALSERQEGGNRAPRKWARA